MRTEWLMHISRLKWQGHNVFLHEFSPASSSQAFKREGVVLFPLLPFAFFFFSWLHSLTLERIPSLQPNPKLLRYNGGGWVGSREFEGNRREINRSALHRFQESTRQLCERRQCRCGTEYFRRGNGLLRCVDICVDVGYGLNAFWWYWHFLLITLGCCSVLFDCNPVQRLGPRKTPNYL